MALGVLRPVSFHNGLPCSGHGIPIPSTIHSTQPCGSPPIPYSITIKNKTCWWPPQPLIPLEALNPLRATVLVHRLPIMLEMDTFTPHISVTTNIINYLCPCGKLTCIIPTPVLCGLLTMEDMGGVGHVRVAESTTFTVFALKRRVLRIIDPLGAGKPKLSWPCSSVVAFGSATVLAG